MMPQAPSQVVPWPGKAGPTGKTGLQQQTMAWFAYILRSKAKNTTYKGSCADLKKRLERHNKGAVRSTKAGVPWEVVYFEEFGTRTEALKREKFFKTRSGYRCLKQRGIV